jgi:hypothetical protein
VTVLGEITWVSGCAGATATLVTWAGGSFVAGADTGGGVIFATVATALLGGAVATALLAEGVTLEMGSGSIVGADGLNKNAATPSTGKAHNAQINQGRLRLGLDVFKPARLSMLAKMLMGCAVV